MSLFLFSTFPKFVDKELQRRRDKDKNGNRISERGKPSELQKPKTPWMRMTSGFKKDGTRKILMGGDLDVGERIKFGFENLYEEESGTGERYRPKPAITGVTVDEKLQSFECTVEWKAHSIGQLDRLFPYFMNLGISVIVDWGWSDVPSEAVINVSQKDKEFKKYFKPLSASDADDDSAESANPNISSQGSSQFDHPKYKKLAKGNGRYSFVSGAITGFSYSPDENGKYDCTTEIMSVSKAMRKLRGKQQETRRIATTSSESERKPYFYEWLQESFMDHLESESDSPDRINQASDIVKIGQGRESDLGYTESGTQNSGYYVSWGEIERLINKWASLIKDGETTGAKNNPATFTLDSSNTIISNFNDGTFGANGSGPPANLRTLDPLVCMVDSGSDAGGYSDKFRTFNKERPEATEESVETVNGARQGYLYNLYIEYQFVKLAFETNETIFDALKYILNKCSAVCFDIWDFELELDSNVIKVVDKNMPAQNTVDSALESNKEFLFKPNTTDSVLRSFNFDTNLDDKVKAQIVAQRNAELQNSNENAAQNAKNDSTPQLFSEQFDGKDVALGSLQRAGNAESQDSGDSGDNSEQNEPKPLNVPTIEKLNDSDIDVDDPEEVRKEVRKMFSAEGERNKYLLYRGEEEGKSYAKKFEQALQADKSENSPVNSNNYLGMGAQLEFDGIGGFSAYQVMKIANVPKIFGNNGVYSVESVSHNVSIDDWSTELKTSFVVGNLIKDQD